MSFSIIVHYDNSPKFAQPHLWVWYAGSHQTEDLAPTGTDAFGKVFAVQLKRSSFSFKFKEGPGTAGPWESDALNRNFRPQKAPSGAPSVNEIWCRGDKAFVYPVLPRAPEAQSAATFVAALKRPAGLCVPNTGGLTGLGANPLVGGGVLFGLYHPNAAQAYVFGTFNDWQRPGHDTPDPAHFHELKLYRGYFGVPNVWLGVVPQAKPGDEYKFCVLGGVPSDAKGRFQQYFTDPYARRLGPDYGFNNSVVVDPTTFHWTDGAWRTRGSHRQFRHSIKHLATLSHRGRSTAFSSRRGSSHEAYRHRRTHGDGILRVLARCPRLHRSRSGP